jgi:hypothetical protein
MLGFGVERLLLNFSAGPQGTQKRGTDDAKASPQLTSHRSTGRSISSLLKFEQVSPKMLA